jgi:FdhD protein
MVIKVAQMGIPVLFSRAGITQMGMELSKELGVTTIARAGGKHFLVYNGADTMIFDAKPPQIVTSRLEDSANNSSDRTRRERRRNAELEV